MKVAITGKGGVGKTTTAALLSRLLTRSGAGVLAVDADPNPNLGIALGMGVDNVAELDSVTNALLRERLEHEHDDAEGHDHGERGPNDLVEELAVLGPDRVLLVQTGRIERPADGCLCCGSHRTSREVFQTIDPGHRVLVADLEAGVNDLMWIMPDANDVVIIVTELYWKSLEVARRALHVAREFGVKEIIVLANRVHDPCQVDEVTAVLPGVPVVSVPDDVEVSDAARNGVCVLDVNCDAQAVHALAPLAARLAARARTSAQSAEILAGNDAILVMD